MSPKILFVATVDYHFKAFHLPYLEWLQQQGWEVHVAAKGNMELPYVDRKYDLPIERSPFRKENINAYRELKSIMDSNKYEIVHCHTPVGGVLTRLAARKARKQGTKVIYTAHGFHFCKGAPLINWVTYYPIERLLSHLTDCLITINEEDYQLAVKHKFNAGRIEHVHGIGVDTERFTTVGKTRKHELRLKAGYKQDQILMFYAAEFNKNKNQQLLIRALAKIKDEVPQARLLLAGEGHLKADCIELANQLGISGMVDFLGYRNDIDELLPLSDIAVASSLREGLPVNILEAMSCELPVVATMNRGHSELIRDMENGFVVSHKDYHLYATQLLKLCLSTSLRKNMGIASANMVNKYSLFEVKIKLGEIYSQYMSGERDESKSEYRSAYI
ncbi:glycosyltransferase family 4 protein [Paenibacillus cremeus]|uniref:Glycosyltransferase family 4 protein n=1 Tax=Paenibacillus cremeus TaxID=2163881 RepID=A0A559K0G4_9BACL|nr:glycosyltransferase family 4 protein [Paenibacillus cremeus]TVY05644.1 glycosyltransferase family 4 protein [Paenibacillus cremeus]